MLFAFFAVRERTPFSIASGFEEGMRIPVLLGRIVSLNPAALTAIAGFPADMDSMGPIPKSSRSVAEIVAIQDP